MNEKPCVDINQILKKTRMDNALTTNFDEIENHTKSQKLGQKNDKIREEQWKQAEFYKTLLNDGTISPESTSLQPDDEIDSETVNPESASWQLYNTKEKVDWEKDNEIKHVEGLILRNDIEWILKYLWLDKNMVSKWLQIKTINFIGVNLLDELESITSPKDIFNDISEYKNDLKFLEGEKDIINETQNEYNKLYNKLIEIKGWKDDLQDYIFINLIKKVFKNLKRLKSSNKVSRYLYKNLMYKIITKDIVELKYALRAKRKDMKKYLKKLNEYEKWEYVNFPNWISFQLLKWPKEIPWTDIKIWENEFYVETHIEVNRENKKTRYIEYVDSLIKARKLFEKKWIKLKYCKRETRLANREFIEEYEKERKKRKEKEWVKYEKSNRLKVLEQTEDAVISYWLEKDGKSPIRFINKDEDRNLFEFAKKNDNFCEAEMWFDIDRLEYQQQ